MINDEVKSVFDISGTDIHSTLYSFACFVVVVFCDGRNTGRNVSVEKEQK